jgi:hypothetical protein
MRSKVSVRYNNVNSVIYLGLAIGLRTVNSKENRKLFKFTEEDKFVFSCFDDIIDTFGREFDEIPKEFIINALKINTLNIAQTYEFLKKPHRHPLIEKSIFNSADDHVIRYMKHTPFYKELIEVHGEASVEDREYFLN